MGTVALLVNPPDIAAPATLDAVIINRGEQTVNYGAIYSVEYWDGKCWQETDFTSKVVFPAIEFILEPGRVGQSETVEIPAEAQSGFYRVTKKVREAADNTSVDLYGLFHVL